MSILIRSFAWLLAAAVTFATLGPPGLRPHSDLGQDGEHALAFILVGLAFGLAYPRRRLPGAGAAVVLIGVLELMQFWAPGRHARLEDFLVDALTACFGFALAAVTDWAMTRFRASPSAASEGPAE
ncbi:antibiotic resistance protein VanZ [Bradyrhizobium sp. CCBAU 65884]|uniref:VanZ family protein n=1 Tax=Bradyrhizobium sp. CCBAU 65884 TaxID=722477 RepID=UPI0023063392|nr:VanZ family protein [Bradyrhizobium sp. CCBAU 65884]MDA9473944.1 antibiotic resistance protein VanZ [Bradyrhizobium sp. CCBAU 65884]